MDYLETVFGYDSSRNCTVPFMQTASFSPTSIEYKSGVFKKMLRQGGCSQQDIIDLLRPVSLPEFDLSQYKTAVDPELIVMSPPKGMLRNRFDLSSEDGIGFFLAEQALHANWSMVRNGLEQLGANVCLAKSIWDRKHDFTSSVLPVEEIFARDAGFIFDDCFCAPSEKTYINTYPSILLEESSEIMMMYKLMGDEGYRFMHDHVVKKARGKDRHEENIVEAFQKAGKELSRRNVDVFFEGGDIIVDQNKGVIFVGRPKDGVSVRSKENYKKIREVFKKEFGVKVVLIDRHEDQEDFVGLLQEERFHLDTFMSLLPRGEMLCEARYTSKESIAELRHIYGHGLILVDEKTPRHVEGLAGGKIPTCTTNLVVVGRTLQMPYCTDSLKKKLNQQNYTVVSPREMNARPSYFYMQGGGPHCVTHTLPVGSPAVR